MEAPDRVTGVRVLQLGPFPPPHGGVQTNLVAIHQALRQRGMRGMVANITATRRPDADDVYYPKHALQLFWLLIRLPYDVVHIHVGGHLSFRLVLLSLMCSLIPRTRAVLTFHSGGYASSTAGRTAHRWTFRALVLRRFDAIIAVNQEIVALFRRLGVREERIHLIAPHAIDVSRLSDRAGGPDLPADIARFVSAHRPLLVTVGLLEPDYDLSLQIAALPLVRRTFANAGLIIVGSGSLHRELEREIAASPERDHLLLCGDVPHAVTLRLISKADVFLRTTLYDGDSISIREALAAGTPVVATENGMRPPGIRSFPIHDLAGLEREIAGALSAGRSTVTTGDRGGVERVLELYHRLAADRGGRRAQILSAK